MKFCIRVWIKEKCRLSLWLKLGDPFLLHIGGPRSPPRASQRDRYATLWQTEHPGVFILYVEASRFCSWSYRTKTKFGVNWFYIKGLKCDVLVLQRDNAARESFCSFSSFEDWLGCSKRANGVECMHFLTKWIFLWYFCAYWRKAARKWIF